MTAHTMKWEQIPGSLGTNEGYVLALVKQETAAAVANNDTLVFKNVSDVLPVSIRSEIGAIIDFDASTASSADWVLTVNSGVVTSSTAAVSIKGLCLIKQ